MKNKIEHLAEIVANGIGSAPSIVLHLFLFIAWLSVPFILKIDWNTDFLALTTFVSLEAIFLALFNQNITNKLAKKVEGQ